MAFLFEPVTAAVETLKYIKSASDKGPDPARFVTRMPINPGKWALNLAFKRTHNLWKWSKFDRSTIARKQKQRVLRIIKHEDGDLQADGAGQVSSHASLRAPPALFPSTSTLQGSIRELSPQRSSAKLKKYMSGSSLAREPVEEDGMPYFPTAEEDEMEAETRLLAEMSPEQRVYHRTCEHYKVKALRIVMRQIETPQMVLAYNKLKDAEFKALTASLVMNFTVKRLDLTDLMLTEQQTTYLIDFLEDDNGITDLILKGNRMEGHLFTRLLQSLRNRDVMIYLNISENNLRDKDIPNLAAYIASSSQLSFLHMARNKFTTKAGDALGKMMAKASLLELDISANQLRGDGMASFLHSVAKSNSLERLNVSWNGIGPENVRGLITLLKQSTSLIELDISSTRINGECLDLMTTQGLSRNSVLQRLLLKNNPLLTQELTTLLTRIYGFPNTAIRRIDLGDYQMLDHTVENLLESLFWEKQVFVKSAGTFTFSQHSYPLEKIVAKMKQDSLSLVMRLGDAQRTALEKHFAKLDFQEAVEQGSEIIATSFLGRANENKVTFKDLSLRINQEKRDPREMINSILSGIEEVEKNKKTISRFSFNPEDIRKFQVKSQV